ncbi:hypothetical protein SLEP1_g39714 [Rubroshorea leprosula]|uniref:Box C/D snoRNA protein 1 n=1 Tax=Rubroshorea leprosula TaxID=152421 RepID=A0AAV5L2A0_9ROSI|nr:hypothetical protein SLEP1_g39714 [Rubroshorea leprosula]
MEEAEASTNPKPMAKEPAFCEECKNHPSKYKCPGCSLRSCSLPCVKAHKQRTGCNGKRNMTKFVPLSEFDDNLLISDYNLLEEVKRIAESAQRTRAKLCGYSHFKLPFVLRSLRSAAASRGTKLWFQPSGMSKREKNQTRYIQREKFISWTIEWRFHSTDVVIVDHGVNEERNLCSVIENHRKPGPWIHQLRHFSEEQLENLKFFIRKYPKGPKSPFRELDMKAPIRKQLANIVIVEYPVIHVFLPSHSFDFEVVREKQSVNRPELKDSGSNDNGSPKGVTFREEEIKEDNNSDPQVFDILKHVNSSPKHQIHGQNRFEKSSNNSAKALLGSTGAGKSLQSSPHAKESMDLEDMKIDFDQGLLDIFSDIMAEINDDDFLPLRAEFGKEPETQEKGKLPNPKEDCFPGELEEGEIAD